MLGSKLQKSNVILSPGRLQRGYQLSIDNAMSLLGASGNLLREYPDKALGLAQLGQEEVGKSLSLLAAGALPADPAAWDWLWSGWWDHELKAHRAYLYEIIHPLRIEVPHPDQGERHQGGPLLDRLPAEKEVSFYVDFDKAVGTFLSPMELVDGFAAFSRWSTLMYLTGTADAIRRALMHDDYSFRFGAFANVALTICSQEIYQQDWPWIREEFATQSSAHRAIIDDIETALKSTADFIKASVNKRRETNAEAEPSADI